MIFLATLTLLSLILNGLEVRLPFRFGSVEKGNVVRPAIYYIVEDVVAVDGNGGLDYREAFMGRYESSEVFQVMIWRLSVVWMVAFYLLGVGFGVFVFLGPLVSVYAVGWAGPFPLAGTMAVWTIFYVKSVLRAEGKGEEGGDGRRGDGERAPLLCNGV
jgi:hypothetical protein